MMHMQRPRVVIVDDNPVSQKLITHGLRDGANCEVVATCSDADAAIALVARLGGNAIILLGDLPGRSWLKFLREVMGRHPVPVVVVQNVTAGPDWATDALAHGAYDYVEKPRSSLKDPKFLANLCAKVNLAASVKRLGAARNLARTDWPQSSCSGVRVVAIGASTGGVPAILRVLAALERPFPPMLIAQHLTEDFVPRLAGLLHARTQHETQVLEDGTALRPNTLHIAPIGCHIGLQNDGLKINAALLPTQNDHSVVNSIDRLFTGIADTVGASAIGVVLTGMGSDGANGARALRQAGALVIGQSEQSCVVYGMPSAAKEKNGITHELPIEQIGPFLMKRINSSVQR